MGHDPGLDLAVDPVVLVPLVARSKLGVGAQQVSQCQPLDAVLFR